ncbi:uncharacterized protein VICG_01956 [Vittaforma corneae ATCC 50505]|uniref:ABC transporter domain-containing protein n=1 Tax=Vittaforma corneae (strain ATCC 50505) TaxID=993615 RepID=L2GL24_VITCO|nr:uncharacterized protein VICG_01956 [Vittaforma corneae ATCC 50505]ELA40997.1 hypothetical protein VICG_01956 [Vittaforma corneae ATCC 50505]
MNDVVKLFGNRQIPDGALVKTMVLFCILECLSKSIIYWIRPIFETTLMIEIESILFKSCICLDFEKFFENGPALNCAKIYRHSAAIKESASMLVFDLLGSAVGLCSSASYLYGIMEPEILGRLLACLALATCIEVVLFRKLKLLKEECVKIDETRAEEMTECFENFFISKVTNTNEHARMSRLFTSDALLRYSILTGLLKLQNQLTTCAINSYILLCSNAARSVPISAIRELFNVSKSLRNLVDSFFELESMRIEVEDLEDISITASSGKHHLMPKDSGCIRAMPQGRSDNGVVEKSPVLLPIHLQPGIPSKAFVRLAGLTIFIQRIPILAVPHLEILCNQKIALVGKNGSGKTTFLKFFLGFFKFNGSVEVENAPVFNISERFLPIISYIPQNTYLNGTVYDELRENIQSDEEMIKISKIFGAHDFIKTIPTKYWTSVSKLSESERQMVKIIKNCSKKAMLLLADEPMYCLADEVQDKALDTILSSPNHSTKLIVIHHKSQINKFDKVLYFENQKILAFTPAEYFEYIKKKDNSL